MANFLQRLLGRTPPAPPPVAPRPRPVSDDPPPLGAMLGFLRLAFESEDDPAEPGIVLRGSLLLALWFGARARTPADIDLECFLGVDYCKMLIRQGMPVHDYDAARDGIRFWDAGAQAGGSSLWVYGTPGERYHAGCDWDGWSGRLQIDLAEPGPYTPADLGVIMVPVPHPRGEFVVHAYSPEAMMAAKLSWLVRGIRPDGWSGEPKDLFDAHLLLTAGNPRPELFQRAMRVIGGADNIHWPHLGRLVTAPPGPGAEWTTLADRLPPLLGDLAPVSELPLLAGAGNELGVLAYADFLDDRGDLRGPVARDIARTLYRGLPPQPDTVAAVAADPPAGWLLHLFGTTGRLTEFRAAHCAPGRT